MRSSYASTTSGFPRLLAEDLGMVKASKNQLRQVFLNIISNARDAMPEGGILSVTTRAQGDNAHVEISDTGMGIRKENLKKIFDSFFTTKDNIKDVGPGSICLLWVHKRPWRRHQGPERMGFRSNLHDHFTYAQRRC